MVGIVSVAVDIVPFFDDRVFHAVRYLFLRLESVGTRGIKMKRRRLEKRRDLGIRVAALQRESAFLDGEAAVFAERRRHAQFAVSVF